VLNWLALHVRLWSSTSFDAGLPLFAAGNHIVNPAFATCNPQTTRPARGARCPRSRAASSSQS
jgi:hypothetical protein